MAAINWQSTSVAIWRSHKSCLLPLNDPVSLDKDSLLGIDKQKALFYRNTENFLQGKPAANLLLWGARGSGKSSLIKTLSRLYFDQNLRIVEIPKTDLIRLPEIFDQLAGNHFRFIIYCDDLTFDPGETDYRVLKSALEGTLEKPRVDHLIYATSNRRHLLPDHMSDNLSTKYHGDEVHPAEAIDDSLALVDRFGVEIGFYPMSQEAYLNIVDQFFSEEDIDRAELHLDAVRYATQRGNRSGRTARNFYVQYHLK